MTFSGPPSLLKELLGFKSLKSHPFPIESPYHASHLYGSDDVDEILGQMRDKRLEAYKPRIPSSVLKSTQEPVQPKVVPAARLPKKTDSAAKSAAFASEQPVRTKSMNDTVSRLMAIISEEARVDLAELSSLPITELTL